MNKTVLFIQEDIFPKLGSMYISSIFREFGWNVNCVVSSLEDHLIEKIKDISPHVVSLSLTSAEYDAWGKDVAQSVKEAAPNCLVLVGGPHATYASGVIETDECIDMICIGEGEAPITTFCERWENDGDLGTIKGFHLKRNGTVVKNEVGDLIDDLDSISFPDRKLYERYPFIGQLSYAFVIATRGCPYKCSFCYNDSFLKIFKGKGKIFRRRSVDNVIKEVNELREAYPHVKTIAFTDDNFWVEYPKGWLREFSEKYKVEAGLPFSCTSFASSINDETMTWLKEANCFAVKMGIETGSQRVRMKILNKPVTDDAIYKAAELLHKHKISLLTYNMLGLPTEKFQDSLNTYEMNLKIKPSFAWCSLLNPYEGTTIADIAVKEGALPESFEFGGSYFGDTPMIIDNKEATNRLQKFFSMGVVLGVPTKAASWIARNIRFNFIYDVCFIIFYALLIRKITGFTLRDMVMMAWHTKVFKYFGISKKTALTNRSFKTEYPDVKGK